jgi:hypothetical protein
MNTTLAPTLLLLAMSLFDTAFSATDQKSAPQLPNPSGSFVIGRVGYDWTDQSRAEALSDDARLIVRSWFICGIWLRQRIPTALVRHIYRAPRPSTRVQRARI